MSVSKASVDADPLEEEVTSKGMSRLIRMMNGIQSACSNAGVRHELDIPQIVVVGGQSAGKSSVLESIVGRHFLPRGSNMVTRCPLILQLHQCDPGEAEYGKFKHRGEERYEDFSAIREEITNQTDKLCPSGEVTHEPILLELHLRHSLSLSLVDLPGRVVNAVGSQAEDIVERIDELILELIRPAGTIILAVSGGDNDIATSPALQMAKKVDPKGERTVGVVTKVDLKPKGTDCVSIVTGELYPLVHGFFAVKCRGHEATVGEKSLLQARTEEADFFRRASEYRRVADRCGIPKLSDFLSALLLKHIRKSLPGLRKRVEEELEEIQKRKKDLRIDDRDSLTPEYLSRLSNEIADGLYDEMYGSERPSKFKEVEEGSKSLGATLHDLFHVNFSSWVEAIPLIQPTDAELKRSINNRGGLKRGRLHSDSITLPHIEKNVRQLQEPSLKLVRVAEQLLRDLLDRLVARLEHLPLFRDAVESIVGTLLANLMTDAKESLHELVNTEVDYVDLNSADMLSLNLFASAYGREQPSTVFENELLSTKNHLDRTDDADFETEFQAAVKTLSKSHLPICMECLSGIAKYLRRQYDNNQKVDNDLLKLSVYAPQVLDKFTVSPDTGCESPARLYDAAAGEDEEEEDAATPSSRCETTNFTLLRITISWYMQCVKSRVVVMAPKIVVHRFIEPLVSKLGRELMKLSLQEDEKARVLLQPSPDYQAKREQLLENEAALEEVHRLMR